MPHPPFITARSIALGLSLALAGALAPAEPSQQGRGGRPAPEDRGQPAPRAGQDRGRPAPPPPGAGQGQRPRGPAAGRGIMGQPDPPPRPASRPRRGEEPEAPERPGQKGPLPSKVEAERYFGIADYNGDGWISFGEAREALGVDRVSYSAIDRNPRDGRVTLEEFQEHYARTVQRLGSFPPPRPDPSRGEDLEPPSPLDPLDLDAGMRPTSVVELFGRAEPRPHEEEYVPRPPRIPGPVPIFRRLDLDGDGLISRGDLTELLRPLHVPVRVNAVIASLDANGDGVVSHEELRASMRGRRVGPER